jgi:hypothetical protein
MDHAADSLVAVLDLEATGAETGDAGMHGHRAGCLVKIRQAHPSAGGASQCGEDEIALRGSGGVGWVVGDHDVVE